MYTSTPIRQSPRLAEREEIVKEIERAVSKMIYPALKGLHVSCKFLKSVFETLEVQSKMKGQRRQFNDRWIKNFRKELQVATGENFNTGDEVKKVCVVVINYNPKVLLNVISVEGGGCKTVLTEYNEVCLKFQKLDSSAAVSEDLFKTITRKFNIYDDNKIMNYTTTIFTHILHIRCI